MGKGNSITWKLDMYIRKYIYIGGPGIAWIQTAWITKIAVECKQTAEKL